MTDKDKEKLHQILSSLWKNDDRVGKMYYNQALQDAQIAIDSLQEEYVKCSAYKNPQDCEIYPDCSDCMGNIREEPVSEDFEEALANEWKAYNDRGAATADALEDNTQELAFAKGFYRGSNWQKAKDQSTIELAEDHAMLAGMEKMKEQMMKDAMDVVIGNEWGHPRCVLTQYDLEPLGIRSKDRVKVIVIKEG